MIPTGDDVAGLIARATPAARRRDAETLTALMQEVSGREPQIWGTIIGFGSVHYRYPTGTEGDTGVLAFAPRKAATTIYLLDGVDAHAEALAELGPHTTGVGCLYLKDLEQVDLDVLRGILERSLRRVEAGGTDQMQLTVTVMESFGRRLTTPCAHPEHDQHRAEQEDRCARDLEEDLPKYGQPIIERSQDQGRRRNARCDERPGGSPAPRAGKSASAKPISRTATTVTANSAA